ncbi:hypothetical protein ES703_98500 [subsurface metagenome]
MVGGNVLKEIALYRPYRDIINQDVIYRIAGAGGDGECLASAGVNHHSIRRGNRATATRGSGDSEGLSAVKDAELCGRLVGIGVGIYCHTSGNIHCYRTISNRSYIKCID